MPRMTLKWYTHSSMLLIQEHVFNVMREFDSSKVMQLEEISLALKIPLQLILLYYRCESMGIKC